MSGPCLSSSVTGRPLRPATRRCLGEPLPHQQADRPRAHPEVGGPKVPPFNSQEMPLGITYGIRPPFGGLSPASGQVAHVLLTRSPLDLAKQALLRISFDLHVLSTPPAFVLSQNQTLRRNVLNLTSKLDCQSKALTRLAIKLTLVWKSRDFPEGPNQAYSRDPHLKFPKSENSRRSTQYDFLSFFFPQIGLQGAGSQFIQHT